MKTNLSSQITLTRIPLRYYRPENAFEHSVLTRLEKIPTNIYESAEEGSFAIAKEIATQIRKKQDIGKPFVIALPGGRSPLSVYKELIRMHKEEKLSFRNVIAFVEYEFYSLAHPSAGNLARRFNGTTVPISTVAFLPPLAISMLRLYLIMMEVIIRR